MQGTTKRPLGAERGTERPESEVTGHHHTETLTNRYREIGRGTDTHRRIQTNRQTRTTQINRRIANTDKQKDKYTETDERRQ